MWNVIVSWLKSNWTFITAIAGVLVFLLYDLRRKKLEIEKLALEVAKLRQESLIYRPSFKEIKEILEGTGHISTRKLGFMGPQDPLEDLGVELHRFLTHLLAYYGDHDASSRVMNERLYATMHHWPDPYSDGDRSELSFPNPRSVLALSGC
jgi:hypothetical protein